MRWMIVRTAFPPQFVPTLSSRPYFVERRRKAQNVTVDSRAIGSIRGNLAGDRAMKHGSVSAAGLPEIFATRNRARPGCDHGVTVGVPNGADPQSVLDASWLKAESYRAISAVLCPSR